MITFHMAGRLFGAQLKQTARDCVRKYGHNGKGDEFGSRYIEACEASYVLVCAKREWKARGCEKAKLTHANQNLFDLIRSLTNALS